MRKLSLLLCMLLLASALCNVTSSDAAAEVPATNVITSAGRMTVEILFGSALPEVVSSGGATTVKLEGCLSGHAPGYPDLPVYVLRVEIPEDMRVSAVTSRAIESSDLPGTHRISLTPYPLSTAPEEKEFTVAAAEYETSDWYPVLPVKEAGEGFMRGRRIASFLVSPVQYKENEQKIRFTQRVSVEIELSPDVVRPLRTERFIERSERDFDGVLRRLVVNPRPAQTDVTSLPTGPLKQPFSPSFRPSLDGSPVEYVIITDDNMQLEFQRLADWKTKSGVSAVVRTVSWIRQNYQDGCDLAETIRKFIRDAYVNWGTTWVLLGGDSDVIPPRYGWSTFTGGEDIPTDMYYQCLDGNWNKDGDYHFGEGYKGEVDPGDNADLYPEVWIGRATVNTVAEAGLFVDKTLGYLKSPPPNFVTRYLFFAEVLFPKTYVPSGTKCDTVALDGAQIAESAVALLPPVFDVTRLYENYLCYLGSLQETKQGITDSLNVGFGLAEQIGHGYRNIMSVGDATMTNADIDALVNGTRAGIVLGENCTSAAFDFNCIGERFILNENGGATCYLGSTRFDYPTTAWVFQDELFELLFLDGYTHIGQATGISKIPFISLSLTDDSFRWTQFVRILFGEPNLPVWTDEPAALSVAHDPEMVADAPWFEVTVTSGGSPVDSAYVCLWKINEDRKTGYTDASGVARIALFPDTEGSFSVTVTKQDYLPYEGTADVVLPSEPYVVKYAQSIDDDTAGLSFGNNDANVDAGETIELLILLRNAGGSLAQAVTATVRTTDTLAVFVDSTASYGDIAADSFEFPDTAFLVQVSRDCPDEHDIVCTIEARDSADSVWTDQFLLRVHAPQLWHASHVAVDTLGGGNGNGSVESGEEIEFLVTLENLGAGEANQVEGRLSTLDPNITVLDSVAVFGSIPAGSSTTGDQFRFVCNDDLEHVFYLRLFDAVGLNEISTFELTYPAVPTGLLGLGSSSTISLRWDVNNAPDLAGYFVYRSDDSLGTYERINERIVERIAYYLDENLSPYARYYYKITAQDSSSNESAMSIYAAVTTNPPLHVNAPFELGEMLTSSSPALVDIDRSGDLEIICGSSKIFCFKHDGSEYIDGDNDVVTLGVFAAQGENFACSPAVADLEQDGHTDVVAVDWNLQKVYVWDHLGNLKAGWPQNVGINPWSTPALGDVDGDFDLEIVVGNADGKVYAWHHNGTEVIDGDSNPSTNGVFAVTGSMWLYGSAALADIDTDNVVEIIIGGRDGNLYAWNGDGSPVPKFPYVIGSYITSSPAVGDIDDDGAPEIVFGAGNYRVYAINPDSTLVPGWPKTGINLSGDLQPSPALGDIDGDTKLDVVMGTSHGWVFAWKGYNGAPISGWPVFGSDLGSQCSPTLGDLDGDGMLEVLFGTEDGRLHGWNHDGTQVAGFPIQMGGEVRGPAIIWDVDGDGYTNVICQNWDRTLYIWDMQGAFTYSVADYPWPMFRHDIARTGLFTHPILTAVELSAFAAIPSEAGVVLEWYTNMDDTLSAQWNVYRKDVDEALATSLQSESGVRRASDDIPEGYVRINTEPVAQVSPHHYRFVDLTAEGNRWYSYLLGRVLQDGEVHFGPYAVFVPMSAVPRAPALSQNFPNPFQPQTMIAFNVPQGSVGSLERTHVTVRIFDVTGRVVRTLVDEPKSPGSYFVRWDGSTDGGERVAGGVYFCSARIGDYSASKKMVVLD
ncbi:MAG: VCBS repeat-containing protein [Candidatus Eiseniibacteriota bacterium]|nr:MAG: VCBS repeat-containing protein [Candidatus Eisenbacteria bacterium]